MSSSFVRPGTVSGIPGQAVVRETAQIPKCDGGAWKAPPAGVPQAETGRKVKAVRRAAERFARPPVEAKGAARRGAALREKAEGAMRIILLLLAAGLGI